MRIAFLTSLIPVARPDTGFEIANAAILDALRDAGHTVTAFGFLRPGETAADPGSCVVIDHVDIENAAVPASRKLQWIAFAMLKGLPVACGKLRLADRGRMAAAVAAAGPFDAIVVNSVMLLGGLPELLTLGPCILVEHNIEYVSAQQSAAHAGNGLMRRLYAREAKLLEAVEKRLWQACAFVWTLSEGDRAALGPQFTEKTAALPLVRAVRAPATETSAAFVHDIGLIGTWTWAPNFIGLDWFLREVCPLMPPDLTIAVAGRLPDQMPALPDAVTLIGRVDDADAFLRSCRIVALSSRAGTGVQLKTIEAIQLGLPAVATSVSCRGFETVPENFTVADTPQAFADALVARVAAIRAGDGQRSDGARFMDAQAQALAAGLARGLETATR